MITPIHNLTFHHSQANSIITRGIGDGTYYQQAVKHNLFKRIVCHIDLISS
uniref:Uncharacterized protein n=1 Tax=viral metagenome TaxID=1070528 RepID=A0A6C0BMF5_9ZZZZ